jgi:hypothetical protein
MHGIGQATTDGPGEPGDAMQRLSSSAQGWHTIQMAVLGFIGICGVLRSSSTSIPSAVQILAAILAITSLAVACIAILLVGQVAYPLNAAIQKNDVKAEIEQGQRRLRTGIMLTVVALILIVTAALSGWWPKT